MARLINKLNMSCISALPIVYSSTPCAFIYKFEINNTKSLVKTINFIIKIY